MNVSRNRKQFSRQGDMQPEFQTNVQYVRKICLIRAVVGFRLDMILLKLSTRTSYGCLICVENPSIFFMKHFILHDK